MKTKIIPTLAAAIAGLSAIGGTAPAPALAQGTDTRGFDVAGFQRIDMAGCDRAVVTLGERFAVSARGRTRDLDRLRIDRAGDTLRIRRTDRGCDGGQEAVRIAVTLPSVRGVSVSGAGAIELPALSEPRFDADISGAGRIELAGLSGREARFSMSGAGRAVLRAVRLDRMALDLSGAGSIVAAGAARALTIDASGAGQIDTRDLVVADLRVDASGAGGIRARADATATVGASGMASVRIDGSPRCTVRKSGMADIRCG